MVLAEAMACGVPVIGLDAPGTHDIVRTGSNGVLVMSEHSGRFAAAVIALATGDQRRLEHLSLGALRTSREWSTELCADRYLRVYERAIARDAHAGVSADAPRMFRVIGKLSRLWGRRLAAGARILFHP
jgi:glycosyltransferase involved in cell wall biosynthesis